MNAHGEFWKKTLIGIVAGYAFLLTALVLGNVTSEFLKLRADAYSDVEDDSVYGSAIQEMTLLGFLQGYGNNLFGPNDAVTRGQMSILVKRLRDREIKALHAQVEEMRATLDLGTCGDSSVQTGEECDDENTESGDGCSAECLQEVLQDGCPGGYAFGEEFPADDGCNVCVCSPSGIACTKMHCSSPTEPVIEEPVAIEPEEIAAPENIAPACGNGICEHDENTLPPHRRFYCPQDCTGEASRTQMCETLTEDFLDIPENYRACQADADCVELEQSCPFLTCGIAVNKSNYPTLGIEKEEVMETCRREGNIKACVTCPFSAAVCLEGRCTLVQESR
ncbi:MAG: S-layer homology domain-containing protein [Patescibacteria group bacterium]